MCPSGQSVQAERTACAEARRQEHAAQPRSLKKMPDQSGSGRRTRRPEGNGVPCFRSLKDSGFV